MNKIVNDTAFTKMNKVGWPSSLYELNDDIGVIDYDKLKKGIDKELGGKKRNTLEALNLKRDIVFEALKEIEGLDVRNVSRNYLMNEVYENIIQSVVSKYKN